MKKIKLSEAKDRGVFRFSLDISEHLGEKAGTLDPLVLGEPSVEDTKNLQKLSDEEAGDQAPDLLRKHIISHPFSADEGEEAVTNDDVVEFILESSSLFLDVTKKWMESLPLAKRKEEK